MGVVSARGALVVALALLGGSCRRANEAQAAGEPVAEPRVERDRLILAATSPQVAALQISPVVRIASDTLHWTGRLVWDEDVTVRIFSPFAGRVASVVVDAGQKVSAGDVLATLAAPDFGQAQADAQRATTDLTLAERTLARERDLAAHGIVAQKDVDAAEADLARARAEQQRAEGRRALYGGDSASIDQAFPLRTPLGGVVVERSLTPGQEVRPDQMLANDPRLFAPLFVVTDPARLWILIDLPETDIGRVRLGAPLVIRTPAWPDRVFHARVTLIGSEVEPDTRTVKVRATVPNPDNVLKGGMLGDVATATPSAASLGVPDGAIVFDGERRVVFVEEQPGRYRRQIVEIGAAQHGVVGIRAGLSAGERVVSGGSLLIEQLYEQTRGT